VHIIHSRACRNHTHECLNYYRVSDNHTLRIKPLSVEINFVRVEIPFARVLVTFVSAEITLRVEITLCV
jgi:hypothetical protein